MAKDTVEKRLRDLRDELAALADRFSTLGHGAGGESVRGICKETDAAIGEVLLDIDTRMEWDDD